MKKFIYLRWLFGLSLGLFLFSSSGNLMAQENEILRKQALLEEMHGPTNIVETAEVGSRAIGDDCSNPIVVNIPGDLPYADMGNTTCGRGNTYSNTDLNGYDGGEDIIYELNVTVETEITVTMDPNGTTWAALGLFSACPTTTGLSIDTHTGMSGSRTVTGTLSPGTYYVMADTYPSPDCITTLDLTIELPPPPPANDFCADAEIISCGDVVNGSTALATNTDMPASFCGAFSTTAPGVYYSFVGNGLPANISLCGSSYDTKLFLYSGNCGALVCETGNDDFCGTQSELNYNTVNGENYIIYVSGFGSNTGDFTLSLSCVQPGIEIVNDGMDIGNRPIGAWMKPASFEIANNPGEGNFSIIEADVDENYGGFLTVNTPLLPYTLNSGETTFDFALGTDAANAAVNGTFTGTFAMFYGDSRAVITAEYSGTAYTPEEGDVYEMAFNANTTSFPDVVSMGTFQNNYDMPGITDDGWDAVYEFTLLADALVSADLTATDAKMAVYAHDFEGFGGPDMENEIFGTTTTASNIELFAGTYYLVVSTTGASYTLDVNVNAMPAPDQAIYTAPLDGATGITNGTDLEWTFGANTLQYQVVIGTTYPPTDIVVDWTSDLEEAYTLVNTLPNLQYFWQVNTKNNNETTTGLVWGFTTSITPAQEVVAVNDELFVGDDVVLNWTSPLEAPRAFLGYNVYRDGVMLNTELVTELTFTDDAELAYNMTGYTYNVTSVFDEGESAYSNDVVVTFSGEGSIAGNVQEHVNNTDIEGATVKFVGVDEYDNDVLYTTTTDADGDYTQDVKVGLYDVTVSAEGYTDIMVRDIVVTYDVTTEQNFILSEIAYPVAVVTATEVGDNVNLEWSFDVPAFIPQQYPFDTKGMNEAQIQKEWNAFLNENNFDANAQNSDRALVEFEIYREQSYLGGTAMELIGTTTQFQFVDFDWSLQSWGVYNWYVVAVYDQVESEPVVSNKLDNDMLTTVDVTVALNSDESPAGTLVKFTNVDESPELVFSTLIPSSGVYEWTTFRKGTYDIAVTITGYEPINLTDVDIFDAASFEWLLIEDLAKPRNLYVTPTAFATWETGTATGSFAPVFEDFNAGTPDRWTIVVDPNATEAVSWLNVDFYEGWSVDYTLDDTPFMFIDSDDAGYGTWVGGILTSDVYDASGTNVLYLEFDQYFNQIGSSDFANVEVFDGSNWVYVQEADSDIGSWTSPEHTVIDVSAYANAAFQVRFHYLGSYAYYWAIDNFSVTNVATRSTREFETYKVFLDGTIITETTETEYQYDVTDLVEGQTYTAEVLTVFTTGNSEKSSFDFIYVACDSYDAPTAFTAAQVEGTLDIALNWTNVDADALDTIAAIRIYSDGAIYQELDITEDVVSTYLDEDLEFGTYSYCLTYIYDSGAETCQGAVCSGDVTLDGNAMVDGMVMQAEYLGGAAIEDVMVKLTDVIDPDITFTFYTDETGAYGGDVLAGTYDYLVMAEGYVSQTIEDVVVALNATVTHDFVLTEFAYPPVNVVATELSDDAVLVTWHNPMYAPFVPVLETFDAGIPSNWTIEHNGTATDTWYMETPGGNPQTDGASLDGTNFAYVDSDEAGSGFTLDEVLYSPVVNSLNAEQLYLGFDQYYRHLTTGGYGIVEVFDGTNWVEVLNQTATVGAWDAPDQQMIDVSQYSNEMFQVRFHYFDNAGWSWYWAVDNVVITDAVTRMGAPVLAHDRSAEREMTGYEIYRTTCVTGDLQLMGMIPATDTSFTDNTWGAAEAGVYKWGVVAAYEQDNDSEIAFSNCLDKDMYTTVSVEVSTNSGDSPIDTDVMFTNTSEPDMGLVYDVTLDETGMYEWTEFRKGMYDIYVNKNGFQPVMETALIEGPSEFAWILGELLNPVGDLYVTPTAYATWREGGPVPFESYTFDFEADAEGWEIQNAVTGWQWGNNSSLSSSLMNFNGNETNFIAVNADAEGMGGVSIVEMAKSPLMDLSAASEAFVNLDYTLKTDAISVLYSLNGGEAVLIEELAVNAGSWINYSVTLPEEALAADVQIIFLYEESGTWSWGGAIDNVVITDEVEASRELQYYKVWLDGIFVIDTENTFYQYDIATLVPGQDYLAEVAAMYSNGMSAKMDYTFTYIPCDSFPGPENLTGEVIDLDDVLLTWGATPPPPPPGGGFTDDFESYTDFVIDFTPWTNVDVDGSATYGMNGTDWPNSYLEQSFIVFNPSTTVPALADVVAHSGDKFIACFAATTPPNNDWVISPSVTVGTGDNVSFWAKSYTGDYGLERFKVGVSTTGLEPADFTIISSGDYVEAPATDWTEFSYDLSAYEGQDIYVGIQCVSNDAFFFMLDDFSIGATTSRLAFNTSSSVIGHGTKNIGESNIDVDLYMAEQLAKREAASNLNSTEVEFVANDLRSVTEFETCPDGSIFSYPLETVDWGVASSEAEPGYAVYQKFDGLTSPIGGVSFWGGNLIFDGGWSSCGSEDPMTFEIAFYQDDAGMPGTQVATFTKTITRDDTGIPISIYGNFYMYTTELGEDVDLESGWISVVGQTASPDCWFMWARTSDASAAPYQQFDGTEYSVGDYGVSLCFTEGGSTPPPPPGGDFDPGELLGANIFRDGELIAEMVTDTFYVDPEMEYGLYDYCVTFVYESGAESCFGSCVEVEVTEDCIAPIDLTATLDEETFDAIYLNWNPTVEEELRYDDGVRTGHLGFSSGTTNSVLGAVHFVDADLTELSWMLSDEDLGGAPHATVTLYVMGLDGAGVPDGNNVLFTSEVSNVDGVWNTFTFNDPLMIEGGFFMGVAYNGFVGLGTDDGVGAPYEYVPNSHFYNFDYTDPTGWTGWDDGFPLNGMIRATGIVGATLAHEIVTYPKKDVIHPEYRGLETAVVTGSPEWNSPAVDTRAFTGYNIYRDGSLLVEGVQENTYTDTEGLEAGNVYCYEVTAIYSYCGESDPSNEDCAGFVGIPEFDGSSVALYPNPATSLVNITSSVEMTRITVINYVGQVVYQSELNDATSVKLNTGSYENGVYVIRLDSENGVVTKRVIIAQ